MKLSCITLDWDCFPLTIHGLLLIVSKLHYNNNCQQHSCPEKILHSDVWQRQLTSRSFKLIMIPVVVCHVVKLVIPVVVCHVVWVPVLVEAALAELLLGLGLVANHFFDIFSLKRHTQYHWLTWYLHQVPFSTLLINHGGGSLRGANLTFRGEGITHICVWSTK